MISTETYHYYQPECPLPSGEVVIPNGLFSFMAFRSAEDCKSWLKAHNFTPGKWDIKEYSNDDIEDVTLLDAEGKTLMRIEEVPEDGIANMLADEVFMTAGDSQNLRIYQKENEDHDEYMDRVYGEAHARVTDAIIAIEERNEFNFASYAGNPETEWYDDSRDEAVQQVIRWMIGLD